LLAPQALTNAGFQSRIRKNAGKFKRAMRAAVLVAELLEQGGQVPQVRRPRGSQPTTSGARLWLTLPRGS